MTADNPTLITFNLNMSLSSFWGGLAVGWVGRWRERRIN